MIDTPRTDDAFMFAVWQGMGHSRLIDLARELERENTALRADKELLDSNTIWLTVDGQPVWFSGCDLRNAIRRAMKEQS